MIASVGGCACAVAAAAAVNSTGTAPPCPQLSQVRGLILNQDPLISVSWRKCTRCDGIGRPATASFLVSVPASATWFGLGWRKAGSDTFRMFNTDIVIHSKIDSRIIDAHCGLDLPPKEDTIGNSGLWNTSFTTKSGRTLYSWQKALTPQGVDTDDASLIGDLDFIWTLSHREISPISSEATMPYLYGSFSMNLDEMKYVLLPGQDGVASTNSQGSSTAESNLRNVKLFHGLIMSFGWGILMPMAALAARYTRASRASWLNEHVVLTKLGAAGSISFIVVAFAAGASSLSSLRSHRLVGTIFGLGVLVTTISGSVSKQGVKAEAKGRGKRRFRCCRVLHIVLGWGLVLLGFYQVMLGFVVYFTGLDAGSTHKWVLRVWAELSSGPASGDYSPVLVLALYCIFFCLILTVTILEVMRIYSGYYTKAGGFCYACGRISKDVSHDAFVRKTMDRFATESLKSFHSFRSNLNGAESVPGMTPPPHMVDNPLTLVVQRNHTNGKPAEAVLRKINRKREPQTARMASLQIRR